MEDEDALELVALLLALLRFEEVREELEREIAMEEEELVALLERETEELLLLLEPTLLARDDRDDELDLLAAELERDCDILDVPDTLLDELTCDAELDARLLGPDDEADATELVEDARDEKFGDTRALTLDEL